jgi:hypothetical protein
VFPYWIRGAIRSDLALRNGVDLLAVSDAQITSYFTDRGVSAQFVYDWQPLTGAAGSFVDWPATAIFLLYAAGTWVKGTSDVITVDTLYDSANLGKNNYTALFTEEGWLVAKTCTDSRAITVNVCANGGVGAPINLTCTGTTAAGADVTPPVAGTIASSSVASTSYTITASGAADATGAGLDPLPYRLSTDNGVTWTAWQASATFSVTGKTTATTYINKLQVRDASGNISTTAAVSVLTS